MEVTDPQSGGDYGDRGVDAWLRGLGLRRNVPMERVRYLLRHSHPSSTQIYDRRAKSVSGNLVGRISV